MRPLADPLVNSNLRTPPTDMATVQVTRTAPAPVPPDVDRHITTGFMPPLGWSYAHWDRRLCCATARLFVMMELNGTFKLFALL